MPYLLGLFLLFGSLSMAWSHDSWISKGGFRNAIGEWCCGEADCFVVTADEISGGWLVYGQQVVNGHDQVFSEMVPYDEAQVSKDDQFWRCKRPDGSRRCFFYPSPSY